MIQKRYQCQKCGYRFVLKIFESTEERDDWVRHGRTVKPPQCEKCGSFGVIEI